MNIGEFCKTEVVTVTKDCSIKDVARLMKENNIGNIIVVEEGEINAQPCGIVTDRDLVLKVIAEDKDYNLPVEEIMTKDLLVIQQDQGLEETIEKLQEEAVRRAPVIDNENHVIGVAAIDDILPFLAKELYGVANILYEQAS